MLEHSGIVVAIASLLVGGIAGWWLWRRRWGGKQARLVGASMQEIDVSVNGGYNPNVVVVRKGIPVRFNFTRSEDDPCSEWVIFSDLEVKRRLPAFKTTSVVFTPDKEGEFLFTCALGMYRGKLIVKRRKPAQAALQRSLAESGEET